MTRLLFGVALSRPALFPRLPLGRSVSPWAIVDLWIHRWSSRRVLAGLDEHMLKDVGLTSGEAMQESEKPFWVA